MFKQLGLVGCGLMGGSLALALKHAGLVQHVVGYSQSPSSSAKALTLGAIDEQVFSLADVALGSDLIVIAVPVAATQATLNGLVDQLDASALIIDVGSTKSDVVEAAAKALHHRLQQFVPCHPIAGAEKSGVEHASATLYQGCQVILTPTSLTPPHATDTLTHMWTQLGCKVVVMGAAAHDAAFAKVSHLPHLLAFAYINSVLQNENAEQVLDLAGTGFKDFSRIAGSEPHMWRDVLLANSEEVLISLAHFEQQIALMRSLIQNHDSTQLLQQIKTASERRSKWTITKA
jgi:prephenate dehydrogenase